MLLEKERIVRLEQNARQALVRDLHDIPTQTISAVTMRTGILKMLLDRGQIDKLKPEIEAVEDMAKQATAEIRHVLFKLRPLALESQGLSVALAQLVEKTRKTFAQNVTLRIDEQVDHVLPMEAQDALFYLVEEAISNARKYAQAQMIKIDVAVKNDQVLVRVADNGVGFDVDAVQDKYVERGSFGMVNMHERAGADRRVVEAGKPPRQRNRRAGHGAGWRCRRRGALAVRCPPNQARPYDPKPVGVVGVEAVPSHPHRGFTPHFDLTAAPVEDQVNGG
ncbi:MAG: hypothetical protein HND48_26605 [Chloroflexi bacterium]|nr:hypothetical protein [Chloroflexota bacterium]